MNERFTYRSIRHSSEGLYKEKGSKFIAIAFPVKSEEEIKTNLQELRKKYYDARHHCYAFRLGASGEYYRANDDQEPSGSAGKPILGQLLSFEVTDILLVVVRYFGGTKLGVGGLIQAYKSAAQDCLEQAEISEYQIEAAIDLQFPYASYNEVMKIIRDAGGKINEQTIDALSSIHCLIPLSKKEIALSRLEKITDIHIEKAL